MLNTINDILSGNVVFVGGQSEVIHGIKSETKDIDIVTPDFFKLKQLGTMYVWDEKAFKRANIPEYNIDIFVGELPDYIEVNGLKFQTLTSMIQHYEEMFNIYGNSIFENKAINLKNRLLNCK